ncbi:8291_t:CDS:2 [Diversispora eburnea]|uniref:8291_t:CDS:1 n=1 Tax=Diversispora eburnea TaxID=1213867 RepID=A0A9N9FN05_9GLOM|nr:8291_t:CDS:2 [Diversispora eburnea]
MEIVMNIDVNVDKDKKEAIKWNFKGAEKGDPKAQFDLGRFCTVYDENQYLYEGRGTVQDITKAIYWLNKANENRNRDVNGLLNEVIEVIDRMIFM